MVRDHFNFLRAVRLLPIWQALDRILRAVTQVDLCRLNMDGTFAVPHRTYQQEQVKFFKLNDIIMETNFFRQLAAINESGEYTLHIQQLDKDHLIVSILFKNGNVTDPASKLIPPLTFKKSSPAEYDAQFIEAITTALPETSKIFCDMEHYSKQQEAAKAQSKMAKEKSDQQIKEKTDKQKKYAAAMQKVSECKDAGKPREAWTLVPDPKEFPDHAEEIQKTKAELSALFAPDLFNA
jgi:DNA segregation ATPase FtsK/SpoIIIE-like protein